MGRKHVQRMDSPQTVGRSDVKQTLAVEGRLMAAEERQVTVLARRQGGDWRSSCRIQDAVLVLLVSGGAAAHPDRRADSRLGTPVDILQQKQWPSLSRCCLGYSVLRLHPSLFPLISTPLPYDIITQRNRRTSKRSRTSVCGSERSYSPPSAPRMHGSAL
ncbi:uncharacterized protein V6R79_007567 [Siganus canaliculatus]